GAHAVQQRVDDAEGAEDPGGEIEERHAGADRRAARLAGDGHDAAEGLHQRLVAGAVLARAGASERRDRAVHQPRVDRRQLVVAQAEGLHRAGPEVLDQDVGAGDHALEDRHALRRLEVERHVPLVAVDDQERRGLPVLVRRPRARLVAARGVFDLDDVGAEIGQEHAAERAGQHPGEVEHADTFEREGGRCHGANNTTSYATMDSMSRLSAALQERILVLDGAMGTMLQAANLTADDFGGPALEGCNEHLHLTRPDVVRGVHRAYRDAGADCVSPNTFGCAPYVLAEYALADRAWEISRAAARLAREAVGDALVIGAMGPSTRTITVTRNVTFDDVRAGYRVQAAGLIAGGVDALLLETCQDTLNVKAAALGVNDVQQEAGATLPLMVSATIEPTGTMLAGQGVEALWVSLEHLAPCSIGLNCAPGPEFMTAHLPRLPALRS